MTNLERTNILKVIEGYCDIDQTVVNIAQNMGTDGVSFAQGGGLAIYNDDMYDELKQVYGEAFKSDVYKTKDGEYRYKNGLPYVFTVYCSKFGTVLNELKG